MHGGGGGERRGGSAERRERERVGLDGVWSCGWCFPAGRRRRGARADVCAWCPPLYGAGRAELDERGVRTSSREQSLDEQPAPSVRDGSCKE